MVPFVFCAYPWPPRVGKEGPRFRRTARGCEESYMNMSWRKRAACQGIDPDVFFPVSDDDAYPAKAVCEMCSVREACLEYALAYRERDGVWGGATERERRRMIRQRRKTA